MKTTLHENIRDLRLKNGLNQVEFAKIMNVTKQCVSNWENDNVLPLIEMFVKMSDYFHVSTDYLLGRDHCETIVVDGLSSEQIAHVRLLVKDLSSKK